MTTETYQHSFKALLEAAKDASEALHQYHPQEYRILVGRGICTFGPCKDLFDAIAKAQKENDNANNPTS